MTHNEPDHFPDARKMVDLAARIERAEGPDRARRYRTPTAKPGEIKIVYGKADRYSSPDLCVAWGDGVDMKCTARLIMNAIDQKVMRPTFSERGYDFGPSLIEELEARGFDITTLRISIQRKPAAAIRARSAS